MHKPLASKALPGICELVTRTAGHTLKRTRHPAKNKPQLRGKTRTQILHPKNLANLANGGMALE
jgi:hypothetical protein